MTNNYIRPFDLSDALRSIRPNCAWRIEGDPTKFSNLKWEDRENLPPSQKELEDEVIRLQADWDSKEYQRLRAPEYPPMTDYLDAVVKGDLVGQQAYIDACLAVKAKYPKPEES
jgi:hypothetical protein